MLATFIWFREKKIKNILYRGGKKSTRYSWNLQKHKIWVAKLYISRFHQFLQIFLFKTMSLLWINQSGPLLSLWSLESSSFICLILQLETNKKVILTKKKSFLHFYVRKVFILALKSNWVSQNKMNWIAGKLWLPICLSVMFELQSQFCKSVEEQCFTTYIVYFSSALSGETVIRCRYPASQYNFLFSYFLKHSLCL